MPEPTPERTSSFEEVFRTAFTQRIKEEIAQDGSIQVEEGAEFIEALANWHVTQSIIDAQVTLFESNKRIVDEINDRVQKKQATGDDLHMLDISTKSGVDQIGQIRQYKELTDQYQADLQKSIEEISRGNTDLEDKLWALSDHLSAFAKDIYKHTK